MNFLKIAFAIFFSSECFANSVSALVPITPKTAKEYSFDVYVYDNNKLARCVNVKFPVRHKGQIVRSVTLNTKSSLGNPDYFSVDLINYDYSSEPEGEASEVRWCSSNDKFDKYEMKIVYADYKFIIDEWHLIKPNAPAG